MTVLTQQLPGGDEQHGVPRNQGLMAQIAGQHGLTHPGGARQHNVAGIRHEGQGHQFVNGLAITAPWPVPFKVGQWA
jgi:hypothetical protein